MEADTQSLKVPPESILVMCSDGLNSMLRDEEINKIVKKFKKPKHVTEQLISCAKKNGGLDNITVITVRI